jgi:hypothetical protein
MPLAAGCRGCHEARWRSSKRCNQPLTWFQLALFWSTIRLAYGSPSASRRLAHGGPSFTSNVLSERSESKDHARAVAPKPRSGGGLSCSLPPYFFRVPTTLASPA